MGKYSDFDTEIEGQMTIDDLFEPPEKMVAVSNIFARARSQMSLAEQKTFVLALSQLEWTKSPKEQSNIVRLDKRMVASVLGYKADSTDLSQNIWREIKDLAPHSHIEIADRDRDFYSSGSVIATITQRKNSHYIRVKFEEDYFSLFAGLGNRYITLWSSDIFRMRSKRSVQFYELLRQMSYSRYEIDDNLFTYGWGIKAFKQMFDIPREGKGSYMRSKGGFNRYEFEKKVIDPLCEDLAKSKMIQLVLQPNGKYYEKVKRGNRVEGYQFYWTFSARPGVADGHEVKAITERVDKNPQILKVAKDIVDGKKKPQKKSTCADCQLKSGWDYEGRKDIDWDDIQTQLILKGFDEDF